MNKTDLTDQDLKIIVQTFDSISGKNSGVSLSPERKLVRDKIVRMITKQPDPIPYCNCGSPDWNHEMPTPYCTKCYGVPSNYKK